MFEYNSVDPVGEMNKYFVSLEPLLAAMTRRATELGLLT